MTDLRNMRTLHGSLNLITATFVMAWAVPAQSDPLIIYSHHAARIDVHDLDLTREPDLGVFKARVAQATDRICGTRPDINRTYTGAQLKLLLPAYERCRAQVSEHAAAAIKLPPQALAGIVTDKSNPSD